MQCKPCRKSRCPICDNLSDKDNIIKSVIVSATGEKLDIKGKLTCSSTNVVYCITCKRGGRTCPEFPQYIGETKNTLKERMCGHRGTIIQPGQQNTSAPVGCHFRSNGHSLSDLEIVPIEKVIGDDMTRKVRQSFYIKKFMSVTNGLNVRS